MEIKSKLAAALAPERKRWVRIAETVLVPSVAIGIGATALLAPANPVRAGATGDTRAGGATGRVKGRS